MMNNPLVAELLKNGFLISPEIVDRLSGLDPSLLPLFLRNPNQQLVITEEVLSNILKKDSNENYPIGAIDQVPLEGQYKTGCVNVLRPYMGENKKREVQDFVSYFKKRYEAIRKILLVRQELADSISINRLRGRAIGEKVSVIGIVSSKNETKNGNIILGLEDTTGSMNVLVSKNKTDLLAMGHLCTPDEVIGVSGTIGDKIIFANRVCFPDIPIVSELKKSPEEEYAVFIGDTHFGIKEFLADGFCRFIKWLRGEYGSEKHREIASRIKYLFVVGDIVEGLGVYPGQEKDLIINDIYLQYQTAAEYFAQIPQNIRIIVCGGNHDALRLSEPQPALDPKYAKPIYDLPNVLVVTNPAVVNVGAVDSFLGFNVLMYHGSSMFFYATNIPELRAGGGINRTDEIMKYLLQKRHLAPTHGSNLYVPDANSDSMVVDSVPDFFVTGHIHRVSVSNYRGVTLINASCWVSQTDDQEKRGMEPQPCRAVVVNLKTREPVVMNFGDE